MSDKHICFKQKCKRTRTQFLLFSSANAFLKEHEKLYEVFFCMRIVKVGNDKGRIRIWDTSFRTRVLDTGPVNCLPRMSIPYELGHHHWSPNLIPEVSLLGSVQINL